jgi:negative regulator of flagellin synthesis FlgM
MRIGLNIPNPPEVSTGRASTSSASPNAVSSTSGADNFSGDTVSLSSLAARALQLPDVRQDKVDSLRQQIATGEYSVDSQKTADAMLKDKVH